MGFSTQQLCGLGQVTCSLNLSFPLSGSTRLKETARAFSTGPGCRSYCELSRGPHGNSVPCFLTSLPPQTSRPWDGSVTRLAILFCWETEAVGGLRVKGGLGGPIDPKWGEVGREELGTWGSQCIPRPLALG